MPKVKSLDRLDKTSDRYRELKRVKKLLRCSVCPPHRCENRGRCPAHPAKKPRYKDKR